MVDTVSKQTAAMNSLSALISPFGSFPLSLSLTVISGSALAVTVCRLMSDQPLIGPLNPPSPLFSPSSIPCSLSTSTFSSCSISSVSLSQSLSPFVCLCLYLPLPFSLSGLTDVSSNPCRAVWGGATIVWWGRRSWVLSASSRPRCSIWIWLTGMMVTATTRSHLSHLPQHPCQ